MPDTIQHISAVIITRDAAETLAATLDSLRAFAEVVVWDNGSVDATRDIAAGFPNVVVHDGVFEGFGPSRNTAAGCAVNDWILAVDSDERVSAELIATLAAWKTADRNRVGVVLRENLFLGKSVRHGGWGADWLERLYHRGAYGYNAAAVHERLATGAHTHRERLSGVLYHDAVRDLGAFLRKVDRYSEIRRREGGKTYSPAVVFLKALFAFFRSFVLKAGFVAGWRGLVIAWSDANGVFFKYMKRYADRRSGA